MQVKFQFSHGLVILAELRPFHFEKKNVQFPFIFISPTVVHIRPKFDIWIRQGNAQVKMKFGHGLIIFCRVMLLSLRNVQLPFILSTTILHIQLKLKI
jgi:hypothetical protein